MQFTKTSSSRFSSLVSLSVMPCLWHNSRATTSCRKIQCTESSDKPWHGTEDLFLTIHSDMGTAFCYNAKFTTNEVHWWWASAHLYEDQKSTGVVAVTQACCEPILQSSTEQWEPHFALTIAAVHLCWLTAHMYVEQVSTGVSAVAQASCEPVLQSSTEQGEMHYTKVPSSRFSSLMSLLAMPSSWQNPNATISCWKNQHPESSDKPWHGSEDLFLTTYPQSS